MSVHVVFPSTHMNPILSPDDDLKPSNSQYVAARNAPVGSREGENCYHADTDVNNAGFKTLKKMSANVLRGRKLNQNIC